MRKNEKQKGKTMSNGEIVGGTIGGDARSITPERKAKYNPSTGQLALNIGKAHRD